MKPNRHHSEIIAHIKHLIGVDIAPFSEPLQLRMLEVDVSGMTQNTINDIERVAHQYQKISIQPSGSKRIAVSLN